MKTSITAPDNSETRYVYDGMGNRTEIVDPLGNKMLYLFDAENRLRSITDALGETTRFSLDGNGNKTATRDALGRVSTTDYDGRNRAVKTIAPDGGVTKFQYDPSGNLTCLTDPLSRVTTWEFDELNRTIMTTDPLSRSRRTTYDIAGRVATQTNARGQTIRYTYDAAGRPVALDLAGADAVTWQYDAVGNALQVADSDSLITTRYDSVNRPTSVQQTYGGLGYSYDLVGRRRQLTNATGTVNYAYDTLNRLTGLADQNSRNYTFDYDADGRLVRQNYPNATYCTLAYDLAGQLTDKVHYRAGGTVLGDNTYVLNAVGNISGWGTADGNTRTFSYDANDRVTAAQSALPSVSLEAFAYDEVGNWTPFDSRLYNAVNEITEDSLYTYSYDLDGNLIEKASKRDLNDVTTYHWDPLNRLIQVNSREHVVRYRYDGFGRRIAKIVDGLETRYVFDGLNVLEERDGSNAVTAVNLHTGLDQLLVRHECAAGATYWIHTDHLGSVEALTDGSGNVVERYRYSTFGQVSVLGADFSALSAAPKIPFTYTAREWEPEVGMYFYRARFMDPRIGRFISQDPLGFLAADLNVYAYVRNRALVATDPSGKFLNYIVGAAIGGGIDLVVQLVQNGGNVSQVNWISVGGSAAVGATGVGLSQVVGKAVAQTTLSVGGKLVVRAVLNGVGGAAISGTDSAIRNQFRPCREKQSVFEASLLGGAFGATGSVVGDVAQAALDGITGSPGGLAQALIDSGSLSGKWTVPINPNFGPISNVVTATFISSAAGYAQ